MCHFVVWTKQSMEVIDILRDPSYAATLQVVEEYYFKQIVHYLFDLGLPPSSTSEAPSASSNVPDPLVPSAQCARDVVKFVEPGIKGKLRLVLGELKKNAPSRIPVLKRKKVAGEVGQKEQEKGKSAHNVLSEVREMKNESGSGVKGRKGPSSSSRLNGKRDLCSHSKRERASAVVVSQNSSDFETSPSRKFSHLDFPSSASSTENPSPAWKKVKVTYEGRKKVTRSLKLRD